MHPDHSILKDVLYREWRQWCKDNGEEVARRRSKMWFTRQMTKRGFESSGKGRRALTGSKVA